MERQWLALGEESSDEEDSDSEDDKKPLAKDAKRKKAD